MSPARLHRPVMVTEVVDVFRAVPPGPVVDATVGAGGHADSLLAELDHVQVIGVDRDDDALTAAEETLAVHADRFVLARARFDELSSVVAAQGFGRVSGVLFDLGMSSMQVDRPDRGFSYRQEGPLDMRMDRRQGFDASEVVNAYAVPQLARVLAAGGEDRFAGRVAAAIAAARPITTTTMLAEVVREAIPVPARRRRGDPAKRTFQALRIEVNAELAVLGTAIDQALELLVPGGRCAVLSYHSGEDRIVKGRFRDASGVPCTCPPELPCPHRSAVPAVRLLWRGAHAPSEEEMADNPRAESARLRAVERLAA